MQQESDNSAREKIHLKTVGKKFNLRNQLQRDSAVTVRKFRRLYIHAVSQNHITSSTLQVHDLAVQLAW